MPSGVLQFKSPLVFCVWNDRHLLFHFVCLGVFIFYFFLIYALSPKLVLTSLRLGECLWIILLHNWDGCIDPFSSRRSSLSWMSPYLKLLPLFQLIWSLFREVSMSELKRDLPHPFAITMELLILPLLLMEVQRSACLFMTETSRARAGNWGSSVVILYSTIYLFRYSECSSQTFAPVYLIPYFKVFPSYTALAFYFFRLFPSKFSEDIIIPSWRSAIKEEIKALTKNGTGDLVDFPNGTSWLVNGCALSSTRMMNDINLDQLLSDTLGNIGVTRNRLLQRLLR